MRTGILVGSFPMTGIEWKQKEIIEFWNHLKISCWLNVLSNLEAAGYPISLQND
jgi:hypothetical protein